MSEPLPPLERLPAGALTLFRLRGLIRLGLYGAMASAMALSLWMTDAGAWPWLIPAAVVGVCGVVAVWHPLRAHDLLISHGVLIHQVVSIPAGRIQHVDVHQGPIERALGLARLQVYTASGGGADGEIPGLARATADALREKLVRREADDVV
jgi:hypothetical protein